MKIIRSSNSRNLNSWKNKVTSELDRIKKKYHKSINQIFPDTIIKEVGLTKDDCIPEEFCAWYNKYVGDESKQRGS